MSLATVEPIVIAALAVLAVAFMILAVRAERRRSAAATALRWLGVACAVLAGIGYGFPDLLPGP